MITAMDINTRRFEQARPGYKPEEVDEFLAQIADQITGMIQEKEDTAKKIEVLVESIRRYKADEDALKDAMIGAQKQGRAVVEEANERAAQILAEAQQKAESIIAAANVKAAEVTGDIVARAQKEQETLERMQNAVSEFKSDLLTMYKSHLELITALPDVDDEDEEDETQIQQEAPVYTAEDMDATKVIDTSALQK